MAIPLLGIARGASLASKLMPSGGGNAPTMRFSVEADLQELSRKLTYLQRSQIPFAASKTLNQLGYQIAKRTMPEKADETFKGGATAWTKKGFKYTKADKRKLFVDVFVDKSQAKYMKFMIAGGTRFPDKRAILVSTKQARLNKYGNFPRGKVASMINDKRKFFTGTPKGQPSKPAGIWERYGRGSKAGGQRIRLVALYTEDAQYMPLFPFGTFGEKVVFSRDDGFAKKFRVNLAQAISTMKR